jgi:hypothetical protein
MEQDWNVYAVYTVVVEIEMVVAEMIVVETAVEDKVMGESTT